jgi:deoxycytidylate deaminase
VTVETDTPAPEQEIEHAKSEPTDDLVVGLVGAVGTDLPWVERVVIERLQSLTYHTFEISMSSLIDREYGGGLPPRETVAYDRYVNDRMTAGNVLRRRWDEPDAVALLAVEEIRRLRETLGDDAPTCAFVVRSLKRPEEARLLRQIYRGQFVLLGCHTPRETRITQLADQIAKTRSSGDHRPHRALAEALADRDEHEQGPVTSPPPDRKFFKDFGQNVEDAFPLSDAYVNLQRLPETRTDIHRFVDLLLGSPFVSPTRDEFAMFHAAAAAVRSADLSRQVGAAIANTSGDILAVGCNEVPRAGGGAYWTGDKDDARDFQRGVDANQDQRDRAMREVFEVLKARGMLSAEALAGSVDDLMKTLDDTRVDGLIEFTRATHAEMAALLDAARRGTAVEGATLYTSTFPCHNCAKHIVSAGITRVVFIEPYPKSLAEQLHGDAIAVDEPNRSRKVVFEHFSGVAPINYFALFESTSKRKDPAGVPLSFSPASIAPKLRGTFHVDIFFFEEEAIRQLEKLRNDYDSPEVDDLADAPQIELLDFSRRGSG